MPLDSILDRVRGGDNQGALAAMTAKVEATRARAGKSAPTYAAVLFEHATVCLALGLIPRAVASLRQASRITGPERDDEKNRLTYLMNLAEALVHHGERDEAMGVAREGLAAREAFYGREHPGYAYGLESVAEVALARGEYKMAMEHARPALAVYDANDHPRVAKAWALIFLAAAGSGARWTRLDIGEDMVTAVLQALADRTLPVSPAVERAAIETLEPLAGPGEPALAAWKQLVTRAREAEDRATQIEALSRILAAADRSGDAGLAVDAALGRAVAHEEQGSLDAAREAFADVELRARRAGDAQRLCRTLRNVGLFLTEQGQDRGLDLLREAAAVPGAPQDEIARSQVALGIQLQHRSQLEPARPLLASALAAMDPADPDAICARSHLRALEERASCECQGTADEVRAQVERMVRERLPAGLLEAIDFADADVSIRVTRSMTDGEARLVADTVSVAMAEMRKRVSQRYGG